MQSAREASVRITAIASMPPSIRPALTAARTPSASSDVDERLDGLAVVVVEGFDRRDELVVGGRLERAVEQAERLHPVLHLVHARATLPCAASADQGGAIG